MRVLIALVLLCGCAELQRPNPRQQMVDRVLDKRRAEEEAEARAERDRATAAERAARGRYIQTLPCMDQCRERHLDCGSVVVAVLASQTTTAAAEILRSQCRDQAEICLSACPKK